MENVKYENTAVIKLRADLIWFTSHLSISNRIKFQSRLAEQLVKCRSGLSSVWWEITYTLKNLLKSTNVLELHWTMLRTQLKTLVPQKSETLNSHLNNLGEKLSQLHKTLSCKNKSSWHFYDCQSPSDCRISSHTFVEANLRRISKQKGLHVPCNEWRGR